MRKLLLLLNLKIIPQKKTIVWKYFSEVDKNNFFYANKKAFLWILHYLGISQTTYNILKKIGIKSSYDTISDRRVELSKQLDKIFNSTVRYGTFKGLKFSKTSWWGINDRGSVLLGLYEKELLQSLQNIPKKYNTFIDLGAADGYYGIGVLVSNLFKKSICYEISEKGREVIRDNAVLNNVLDRVEIRSIAKNNFYSEIDTNIISNAVLFVDIEGAEFELFDTNTFAAFSKSIVFIELHDWFFVDGSEKLQKIKYDSILTHTITEITMKDRDISIFPELKEFHDSDRWLICSEGRSRLMTWLRFDPKKNL
jgi:hypothetical protein